jgi:hypothetical protein
MKGKQQPYTQNQKKVLYPRQQRIETYIRVNINGKEVKLTRPNNELNGLSNTNFLVPGERHFLK